MDRKSKLLLWAFAIIVILVAAWGYKTFFIDRNFVIQSTTTCDPTVEACFMWCEENECEEEYYKKITKRAYNIPICNSAKEECEPLACEVGEKDCVIQLCSVESVEAGEICTNPVDFQTPEVDATSTEQVI